MSCSRTDVMHLAGPIPQAMSTLCATAAALHWTLTARDADTAMWTVAHGWVDWKIQVCANFLEADGVTTVNLTSHSDVLGADSHVEEAAMALQAPAQFALPVIAHYGEPLLTQPPLGQTPQTPQPLMPAEPTPQTPPFDQPLRPPAPIPSPTWPAVQPPTFQVPAVVDPPWSRLTPPTFTPWPLLVQGGAGNTETLAMNEEEEGGEETGLGGGGGGGSPGGGSPSPEPVDPPPKPPQRVNPPEPRNPFSGLAPVNRIAERVIEVERQRHEIQAEIQRVEKRLAGGTGPIEHANLEQKLQHLHEWLNKLGG